MLAQVYSLQNTLSVIQATNASSDTGRMPRHSISPRRAASDTAAAATMTASAATTPGQPRITRKNGVASDRPKMTTVSA